MHKNKFLILSFFFLFIIAGCNENEVSSGNKVELYLIDTFNAIDNTEQIIEASVVLAPEPLIYYEDILSYDQDEFLFRISEKAISAIEQLNVPVNGIAFAIAVDRKLIYSGYFWPSYSSATCQWVYTDPLMIDFYEGLKIMIGYPSKLAGQTIPDNRNDPRMLQVLKRDGKLVD
jgi:hypothetical protein